MRDLGSVYVKTGTMEKFDMAPPRKTAFLKPGGILFRSRGVTTTTVTVPQDIGKAVLAAPLFLIRIKDNAPVLSEYLCRRPVAERNSSG